MAYAGAQFASAILTAAFGSPAKPIVVPTFVSLSADAAGADKLKAALGDKAKDLEYFSTKVQLGKSGVDHFVDLGEISAEEKKLLDKAVEDLGVNISTVSLAFYSMMYLNLTGSQGVNFLKTPKL
jgi:malate dehydrogenase